MYTLRRICFLESEQSIWVIMDHLQPARVDPRKQALLEARFGGGNKVSFQVGIHLFSIRNVALCIDIMKTYIKKPNVIL